MQIQKINLDFSQNYYKDIVVKQNDKDSRSVIITVTDNGIKYPLDSSIHMCNVRMLTPDNRAIYNETTILSDGTLQIDFTEQMVLTSGTGDLEIEIATSTQKISTMHLNVVIIGNVYPDDTIIASDEFSALTAALLKVQGGEGGGGGSVIVPDGVTYVDFEDSEDTTISPIEQINGVSIYHTNDNKLMATWENDGTQEIELSGDNGNIDVEIPTKVSELENDTGYIIADDLSTLIRELDIDAMFKTIHLDSGESALIMDDAAGTPVIGMTLLGATVCQDFTSEETLYNPRTIQEGGTGFVDSSNYVHWKLGTPVIYNGQILLPGVTSGFFGIPISESFANTYTKATGGSAHSLLNTKYHKDSKGQYWICDEVDMENGIFYQRANKVILDGSDDEIISKVHTDDNYWVYKIEFPSSVSMPYVSSNEGFFCDKLNIGISSGDNSLESTGIVLQNNGVTINIGYYMSANTLREVRQVLSQNPITVYYLTFNVDARELLSEDYNVSMLNKYRQFKRAILTDSSRISPTAYLGTMLEFSYATNAAGLALALGSRELDLSGSSGSGTDVTVPTKVSELENDAGYITANSVPTKVSELENDAGYITADDLTTLDGETIYSTERKTLEVTAYADTVIDSITLPAGTYYVQGMFQYSGTDLRYLQRLKANNTSFANMSLYDNAGVVVGCVSGVCELDSESVVEYQVYLNKRDESGNPATCELKFVSMTAARISSGMVIENSTNSHIVDYSPTLKAVNHRGYSAGAPENTLPAYILSKKKGFKYAECDVAFTSDGVAVLLHDDTIDRTSDGSGSISSLTYEQLLTYDFGSWFSSEYAGTKIPTFEEFIKLCKHIDLHPYIELKSSGNYTQEQITSIVDMVKAMGMKGRVTYISFNADFLGYVKVADSSARLGYLSNTVGDSVLTTVTSLRTGTNEVYASVKYTSLTDTFISDCIDANIPLEIWTVNDAEYIKNMNSYISGVTSDSLIANDILCGEYIDSVGTIGFPTDENGTANHGVAGQFLVSNGDGSVSFVDGVTNTNTFTDGELKPWLYDTSGEEVVIGVYNGKPIYRKYFELNVKTVDGLTTFPISDYVSNYEKIINHKMYTTSGNILNEIHAQQGTTDNQNWICYFVNVGMGLIQVTCSTTRPALDYVFTCMMEYTKTTDAEGSGNNMTPYGVYCTTQVSGELKPWLYSTEEEVIVGVYKGKPLYRKCYDITGVALTADKFYVHPTGLSNVERYVNVNGALVNHSTISASSLPQEKHTDVQGITLLVNESLGGIHISASKDNVPNENVHWLITLEYTKTTDAEGSGNSLNPYGIYNSKLDDIEARLSAFESIVVAEGGAY